MTNLEKEKNIQQEIYKCVDEKNSFLFKAGAGAGKTYALVKTLEYIAQKQCVDKQQNVVCITYTNNAVNEIKERLFNNNIFLIGTIHDVLWSICSKYQNELRREHQNHIENIIINLEKEIKIDIKKEYDTLNITEYLEIYNDPIFWNSKATEFRSYFEDKFIISISNVTNFKRRVKNEVKLDEYMQYLEKNNISSCDISYDATSNFDRLIYNKISHDTMIRYCTSIIKEYPTLRKIIVDRFPYIFIDECQDTITELVDVLAMIDEEYPNRICIGYYGDFKQKIYSSGVGSELVNQHKNLIVINKIFNRRSKSEIINFANKFIEDENEKQASIFENNSGGKIEVFCKKDELENKQSNIKENDYVYLYLTNNDIFEYLQITNLVHIFNSHNTKYKGASYGLLNQETISSIDKLGNIQVLIYNIIKPFVLTNENLLSAMISKKVIMKNSVLNVSEAIKKIQSIDPKNVGDIVNFYESEDSKLFNDELKIKYEEYDKISDFIIENIMNIYKTDESTALEVFQNLLEVNYKEILNWYTYLIAKENGEAKVYTLHGSKGLEFENVTVFLGDTFGKRNSGNIKKCLKSIFEDDQIEYDKEILNLLYVAITRAKSNLKLVYLTDSKEDWMDKIK